MKTLGFVGVGAMGRGMCDNLIDKSGLPLSLYDINPDNADYFKGRAEIMPSSLSVFEKSDAVFLSLPNSDIVNAVAGEFLNAGAAGKIVIDVSTSLPIATKALYEKFKACGGAFIDAPLLGGPANTAAGDAPCIVSGDRDKVDAVWRLIACYADPIDYLGASGTAHTAKLAMNFLGLGYATLVAQTFPLMEKLGVDARNLYEVMKPHYGTFAFNFYGNKTINRDYHLDFALGLGLKDMNYVKALYDQFNVPGFMLDGMIDLLRVSLKDGNGDKDYSRCAATMYQFLGLDPENK